MNYLNERLKGILVHCRVLGHPLLNSHTWRTQSSSFPHLEYLQWPSSKPSVCCPHSLRLLDRHWECHGDSFHFPGKCCRLGGAKCFLNVPQMLKLKQSVKYLPPVATTKKNITKDFWNKKLKKAGKDMAKNQNQNVLKNKNLITNPKFEDSVINIPPNPCNFDSRTAHPCLSAFPWAVERHNEYIH